MVTFHDRKYAKTSVTPIYTYFYMGGVNHCSLHCRLAKFRGLMIMGKYGAVIGRKTRFFVCARCEYAGYGVYLANHSAVFPHDHQTTEFRQTTVRSATLPISGKLF